MPKKMVSLYGNWLHSQTICEEMCRKKMLHCAGNCATNTCEEEIGSDQSILHMRKCVILT